ncbi:MAG: hypothetical protein M1822_004463 [Bathelium mastoideum]|nr:MAG: hypothetical protein M1822_004463 [Bathelium mastoideum]
MAEPSISDLSNIISESAKILNNSYDPETWEFRSAGGPATSEQNAAIDTALEAVQKLQRMLLGPIGYIASLGAYECDLTTLHIIHDFSIAKHVPENGTIGFPELARRCGLKEVDARRVLRYAMTNRIFSEPTPGQVAHTPISRRLAQDPLVRSMVSMVVDEQYPASASLSRALKDEERPARAAWQLANGAERPIMEDLQLRYPERATLFAEFMKYFWTMQNPLQPLIDNYDWDSLGAAHVVDVGGGMGHASIALAQQFPHLSFTVQDFEKVVEAGQRELPEALRERVRFMEHDFFHDQPTKGADVYLLRSILHDWPDDDCSTILKKLTPALKSGAKVLINDFVMPNPGELGLMRERRAR